MLKKRIYLDNAASTPVNKNVMKAIKPYMTKYYGNPSSIHKEGFEARSAIEEARAKVARALKCSPAEIFFTSGASEGNSCILKSDGTNYFFGDNHFSVSAYEGEKSSNEGPKRLVYSAISSEMGIHSPHIFDMHCEDFDWVHADLTQAIGKEIINLKWLTHITTASFSGHKFGALKGVGVLFVRLEAQDKITPLIRGKQESLLRGGTENVVGIVSLGVAIEEATRNVFKNKMHFRILLRQLENQVPKGIKITISNYSSGIANITFKFLNASTAVRIFDFYGVAVSAGSACNLNSDVPSKELLDNGYSEDEALKTIRVSLGLQNKPKEIKRFCRILRKIIDKYDTP